MNKIRIEGNGSSDRSNEIKLMVKLLEALTTAHCLDDKITWQEDQTEDGDAVLKIHIIGDVKLEGFKKLIKFLGRNCTITKE
jgi:hypothetical protein